MRDLLLSNLIVLTVIAFTTVVVRVFSKRIFYTEVSSTATPECEEDMTNEAQNIDVDKNFVCVASSDNPDQEMIEIKLPTGSRGVNSILIFILILIMEL